MQHLTLFSTSGCHLCALAENIIADVSAQSGGIKLEIVDIADSDTLFEAYGLMIPVLRHASGDELHWPFTQQSLLHFLRAAGWGG